jgi:glutaredoxin
MTVTIYTRANCPCCESAKAALRANGELFEEVDVATTPGAEATLRELSGGIVVPTLVEDDGEVRVGFGHV